MQLISCTSSGIDSFLCHFRLCSWDCPSGSNHWATLSTSTWKFKQFWGLTSAMTRHEAPSRLVASCITFWLSSQSFSWAAILNWTRKSTQLLWPLYLATFFSWLRWLFSDRPPTAEEMPPSVLSWPPVTVDCTDWPLRIGHPTVPGRLAPTGWSGTCPCKTLVSGSCLDTSPAAADISMEPVDTSIGPPVTPRDRYWNASHSHIVSLWATSDWPTLI